MLTRDLLRMKLEGDRVVPLLLKPTPGNLRMAEDLLAHWRGGVGQRRGDLEDAALPIHHRSRAQAAARGVQKLITDACRFADPASTEVLRGAALAASAALIIKPAATSEDHRAAVAEQVNLHPDELAERLYADLPHLATLEAAPTWTPAQALARYDLALCQGLLLGARALDVTVLDADTGLRRRLLKALRWRRLLADVRLDAGDALRLTISGPASVLDQASRYGLQLALFLPDLATAANWRASADIELPRGKAQLTGVARARLDLSHELGLRSESAFLAHVPDELRDLGATLAAKLPGWRFVDAQLLPLPSGELIVPDLQIEVDGAIVAVELFHRWHGAALRRRLDHLAQGLAPRLVIGVERALAKADDVATHPAFVRHGFVFSEIPVARALKEAVGRIATR
ncbi:MAG: DUF790 family protein [Planctomycetes bacterium]|nr:DUF790 family protein [Planctomycetota bacterium]